jgi:integrase
MNHDGKKSRRILKPSEPRPRLNHLEARRIFESIDGSDVSGLRDRALIALIFYNHIRPGDALRMTCGDLFWRGINPYLRVPTTRGGYREDELTVTCFPEAEVALNAYIEKAGLASDLLGPLFRTLDRKTGKVTRNPFSARAAHLFINQHARRAGIEREISLLEFRAAGAQLLKGQAERHSL